MSLGLALLIFVFASSICLLLVSLVRAPIGVEDHNGFVRVRPIDVHHETRSAPAAPSELPELASRV